MVRTRRRIGSAALEADGYHPRVDAFTSLAVVVAATGVALDFDLADPLVGLAISLVARIAWKSVIARAARPGSTKSAPTPPNPRC